MKQVFLLITSFILAFPSFTNAQTYPEVWFENSSLPVRYSNSHVTYQGNSWIKNQEHQLPVSDSIFFTPNNALEINYVSGEHGKWAADIQYPRSQPLQFKDESVVSLKIFVQSETSVSELPALEFIQPDSLTSRLIPLRKFIKKFEKNKWLSIEIPIQNIALESIEKGIQTIRLVQNSLDGKEHVVFIDQIEIMPTKIPQSPLTSAAVLSTATGFEKHVDLTWKLPLTPSILYIKVYRSTDKENFIPVAIRPIFVKKYSDIVPENEKTYYYKVSWVDYKYQESPLSNALEVKTKTLSDEELIKMVQNANVNYFIDGEEFNSGMQLKNISNQNPLVSVRNTSAGILALISTIKDDFERKELLFKRLEKIVSFLEKAESMHGVFPELLNGRTGKANRMEEGVSPLVVNLESTGLLMQSLLVAKEYFGQSNEAERQLRARIEKLWRAVEWNAFMKENNPYLYSEWSAEEGLNTGTPLSGLGKMYLYILALASPEFNIDLDSYHQALQHPLKVRKREISLEDSLLIEEYPEETASILHYRGMDYYAVPYKNGHTYYGIPLAVGDVDDPLDEILVGFMALDPRGKEDDFANYFDQIKNLIQIQHRQSLETNTSWSSTKLNTVKGIAIYPFNETLALEKIKEYYLKHADLLWTEYGFVREIDFTQNRLVYPKDDLDNALNVIMINNGRTGLIWQLFSQDSAINEIMKTVFKN
jgi:hypothetical protein